MQQPAGTDVQAPLRIVICNDQRISDELIGIVHRLRRHGDGDHRRIGGRNDYL